MAEEIKSAKEAQSEMKGKVILCQSGLLQIAIRHFNHKNIIKYEPDSRGQFNSIEEMNETIMQNWNSVVNNEDTIYVLGDFFMGHISTIEPILNRLKGKIILIRGNHDQKNRRKIFILGCFRYYYHYCSRS